MSGEGGGFSPMTHALSAGGFSVAGLFLGGRSRG